MYAFFRRKVLAISDGVHEPGNIKWDLCLCLLLAWLLVYFCIWKGIRGSSKVSARIKKVFDITKCSCKLYTPVNPFI